MKKGLTSEEGHNRIQIYGLNIIDTQKKESFLSIFLEQFSDFFIRLLIISSVISFLIGKPFDAILILTIVILNAMFGIYQEKKASEAIQALHKMTVSSVRVMRDGEEIALDSKYLVPGDVIFIEEGTKVPADCTLLEAVNLELNEAALTGESLPVSKKVSEELFMGTIVSRGRGYAEVVKTGTKTKFGQIAQHLSEIEESKTPLQKKLSSLSRAIGIGGLALSVVVFILSLLEKQGYFSSFLLAISLTVAVIPEGLPAVMTITLALGVKKMAEKKAIIRKLSAIEALGSITLIATDKTGTLTANKMHVKELWLEDKIYDRKQLESLNNEAYEKILLNGILNSTASLVKVHQGGNTEVLGDPTEGALLMLASDKKYDGVLIKKEWQLLSERPFDSITKRMTVTVKKSNNIITFTKGAPESILSICSTIGDGKKELNSGERKSIEAVLQGWAAKGLRVLAFSYINEEQQEPHNQVFLGMVAIHDAPRPEVKEAIAKTHAAGIKVVMITGDNELTAEAVATQVGLLKKGDVILTGQELDEYSDEKLMKILPDVKVFARTTPFHKSRIVQLYQKLGEIVLVTGDGVNDAIALKQADVGVAMGVVGTDVARETASMVITDDNFATIVNAIEEGRNIIKNLKNAIKYLITGNVAEAISLVAGLFLGMPQLFYPVQVLYTNLITDGIPALACAFSPRDARAMNHPPDKKMELLIGKELIYMTVIGVIGGLMVIGSYFFFLSYGHDVARTVCFEMVICMQSFIFIDIWLSHHSLHKNFRLLFSPVFAIAFLLPFVLHFLIVSVSPIAQFLYVTTIPLPMFIYVILISSMIFFCIRILKPIIKLG